MLTQLAVLVLIAHVCSAATTKSPRVSHNNIDPFSDEFIKHINSQQLLWKAGKNFHGKLSLTELRKRLGVPLDYMTTPLNLEPKRKVLGGLMEIPESFDSRTRWPNCPTIRDIHDQGSCASCWAMSVVDVMSDRHCIHSQNNSQFHYSTQDMLFCCEGCGQGCGGGDPTKAWEFWAKEGVVSAECKPYRPFKQSCTRQCVNTHPVTYEQDKISGKSVYKIEENEKEIQIEIMKNGPVKASFIAYDDYFAYKSGVYKHTTDNMEGAHGVRIIGWGEENGAPYWLVANSLGSDWGENGYFKILRGSNECGIESKVIAGLPH